MVKIKADGIFPKDENICREITLLTEEIKDLQDKIFGLIKSQTKE